MKARELLWNLQRQIRTLNIKGKEINKESIYRILIALEQQVSIDEQINDLDFEYEVDEDIFVNSKFMIAETKTELEKEGNK